MKELTLSSGELKVLSILISSVKECNLHHLASSTKLSVMGVSKIIKKLEKKELVMVIKLGKSYLVRLNKSHNNLLIFSLIEQYKFGKFTEKHPLLKGFLIQLREKLHNKADFSLIFGSYASGEESTKSDLDFLIVSRYQKEVVKIIKTLKVLLAVDFSPVIITPKEFTEQVWQKHRLYREIVEGKRVIIQGEYEFWKTMLKL